MMKYLLTFAAAALAAGTMMAEDVTLSVNAATDIQGTFIETAYKTDGSLQAAAHYEPVESFKIGDFSFSFAVGEGASSKPALYLNAEATIPQTIRLYKASQMTISFSADAKVGSIICNLSQVKGLDNNVTVNTGEIETTPADKKIVWNNTGNATSVTFVFPSEKGSDGNNPNLRIESFTVSAEGQVITPGDDPQPNPGDLYNGLNGSSNWTLENTVLPEGFEYIWSWDSKYNCLKASAYKDNASHASESWAISPVIDLTAAQSAVANFMHAVGPKGAEEANIRFFQENCGFYVREEGGEWNQLTIATWPVADWQFVNSGDMDLNAYVGKKIQLGAKYASSDTYSVTWEIKDVTVKDTTAGVAIVAGENEAPVYFDLNGRRVAEPANGLFIKVQGSKATKVIVK